METIKYGRAGQEGQEEGKRGLGFIHQGLHMEGSPPRKKGGRAECAVGEGDLGGEGSSWGTE